MTNVRFHKPYHPNDGHGPGVPLPDDLYGYLLNLDGREGDLAGVIENISRRFPGAVVTDKGDYIGIKKYTSDERGMHAPSNNWWAIGYESLKGKGEA